MFSGRVSVENSNLNPARTRAAVARLAVALERRLKENAPINKNPSRPSKGLRQSIKVIVGPGSLEDGIDIQARANDYIKYVIGGTAAHTIRPNQAKVLAFPWNTAARSHETYGFTFGARIRRSSRGPVYGYRGLTGDLRRLVRKSDLGTASTQAFFPSVNHPGASANDFIPEAIAQVGPELAAMEDAIGQDLADQIMATLGSTFSGSQSVRL